MTSWRYRKDGMDINVQLLRQRDLPGWVFENGVNPLTPAPAPVSAAATPSVVMSETKTDQGHQAEGAATADAVKQEVKDGAGSDAKAESAGSLGLDLKGLESVLQGSGGIDELGKMLAAALEQQAAATTDATASPAPASAPASALKESVVEEVKKEEVMADVKQEAVEVKQGESDIKEEGGEQLGKRPAPEPAEQAGPGPGSEAAMQPASKKAKLENGNASAGENDIGSEVSLHRPVTAPGGTSLTSTLYLDQAERSRIVLERSQAQRDFLVDGVCCWWQRVFQNRYGLKLVPALLCCLPGDCGQRT